MYIDVQLYKDYVICIKINVFFYSVYNLDLIYLQRVRKKPGVSGAWLKQCRPRFFLPFCLLDMLDVVKNGKRMRKRGEWGVFFGKMINVSSLR